jgi:excinuclease ABC subunit A
VYSGELKGLLEAEGSITGAFLSGRRVIPTPEVRRTPGERWLKVLGAREHNLKDADLESLGLFVCVMA